MQREGNSDAGETLRFQDESENTALKELCGY